MEDMGAMVLVMAVDTDIAALDMVDTVMDTEAMDMVVTTTARDPLMPNQKLMPDICMEDTDMVLMAVDTDSSIGHYGGYGGYGHGLGYGGYGRI